MKTLVIAILSIIVLTFFTSYLSKLDNRIRQIEDTFKQIVATKVNYKDATMFLDDGKKVTSMTYLTLGYGITEDK